VKGFRTIAFSALMTGIGMLGVKISPASAENWADIFFAVWGIGAILLRQITNTPIGAAVVPEIDAVLAHFKLISAQLSQGLSRADIDGLTADLQTLLLHANSDAALAGKTSELAAAITLLAPQLQALIAQGQRVAPAPIPDPSALPKTPATEGAVSVSTGDDAPVIQPSPVAPAQPSAAIQITDRPENRAADGLAPLPVPVL
jgi:hypothetical protein